MAAEQILPGLYRIVVPLPGSPLKEVNSYVFTSRERNLVVDTGMNRPECREAMDAGLDDIGIDLEKTDFIATHLHADHHGLVASLLRPGRRAYMGAIDAAIMKQANHFWQEGGAMSSYAERNGFPAAELAASMKNHPGFKYRPQATVDYIPLLEGDVIEIGDYELHTVDTPGHTDGHISFYDPRKKLFVAGDHVLGDITPNIQTWSDDDDSLGLYLRSLNKVSALDVGLCLPGHRSLIEDFPNRLEELAEHHRERANDALEVLEDGPRHAYGTAASMSWDIRAKSWEDFPIMQRWFATGETIAHLRYLDIKGLVERSEADGTILYANAGGRL